MDSITVCRTPLSRIVRPTRNARRAVAALFTLLAAANRTPAQQPAPRIPLVSGLTFVSALHFPEGDRENVIVVSEVSAAGAQYTWRYEESATGSSAEPHRAEFHRFVRASDLAGAPRIDQVFLGNGPAESPGFTAFSVSTAIYNRLQSEKQVPFSVTSVEGAGSVGAALGRFGGMLKTRVTLRGTLSLPSARAEPMSLLLNGQRVIVPTLRLVGRFSHQGKSGDTEMWVVADSAHPLVVRIVNGHDVLQTIRIDLPASNVALEKAMSTTCRAELPGIYFPFNSASLDDASAPALASIAAMLQRHPDWSVAIEGHTDSIGAASSNQTLSQRRSEQVRGALSTQYKIAATRMRAVGYGAIRPRETNAALEGRARNRRVELVRPCAKDS